MKGKFDVTCIFVVYESGCQCPLEDAISYYLLEEQSNYVIVVIGLYITDYTISKYALKTKSKQN